MLNQQHWLLNKIDYIKASRISNKYNMLACTTYESNMLTLEWSASWTVRARRRHHQWVLYYGIILPGHIYAFAFNNSLALTSQKYAISLHSGSISHKIEMKWNRKTLPHHIHVRSEPAHTEYSFSLDVYSLRKDGSHTKLLALRALGVWWSCSSSSSLLWIQIYTQQRLIRFWETHSLCMPA